MRVARCSIPILAVFLLVATARAEVHGGIEIGAKGVKATVIEVTGTGDAQEIKVLLSGSKNTTLTEGLRAAEKFAEPALKATGQAVADFADRMQKEFKVPAERIYVVGSSGLFSALEGKAKAIQANQALLADAVAAASNLKMTFIDADREAQLSIAGIIPPHHAENSLLLDIGSGNTKGGYRDKDYITLSIPYGSVTFVDLVKKQGQKGTFAERAAQARETVLLPGLKKAAAQKPGVSKRTRVYLSGGAVWALATLVRPGDRSAYVKLTAEDIDAYHKLLLQSPEAVPTPDLSAIKDEAAREAAKKDVNAVKTAFKPEQLLAGAEILKAMAKEYEFGGGKQLFFARNAQIGWILAFVTEKSRSSP